MPKRQRDAKLDAEMSCRMNGTMNRQSFHVPHRCHLDAEWVYRDVLRMALLKYLFYYVIFMLHFRYMVYNFLFIFLVFVKLLIKVV